MTHSLYTHPPGGSLALRHLARKRSQQKHPEMPPHARKMASNVGGEASVGSVAPAVGERPEQGEGLGQVGLGELSELSHLILTTMTH